MFKYVFGPSQTHFNESESGQKHIYAREHQLYCYNIVEVEMATSLNFCL